MVLMIRKELEEGRAKTLAQAKPSPLKEASISEPTKVLPT